MSDYTSWHVGMKVVCVVPNGFRTLTKGAVYTIRDMDEAWVYFEEPSTLGTYGPEWAGYAYFRFRPVQTRKTDISIFTDMLIKHRERV